MQRKRKTNEGYSSVHTLMASRTFFSKLACFRRASNIGTKFFPKLFLKRIKKIFFFKKNFCFAALKKKKT